MGTKSISDINDIRDKIVNGAEKESAKIYVHMGTCGIASGATEVLESLKKDLKENNIKAAKIIKTGCAGICSKEPLITVAMPGQEPIIYEYMDESKVQRVVREHIISGTVVKDFAFARGMEAEIQERIENKGAPAGQKVLDSSIPGIEEIPFFKLQKQRVMRNRAVIDPNNIEHYIGRDGYQGLIKALSEMSAEDILKTVLDSGIRGRGGAGFPTGLKWKFAAQTENSTKYVLCNADEGDPGAYMDRSVLESDPHSILEGMVIAGKAIGSHKGYVYCRAEYPLAVEILNKAIKTAKKYNLLGENILGTGFDFDIEVYEGAGAFVCGEETALMRSIEGFRGNPRPRPPFPAVAGLKEKPTILNNVETLSNISQIVAKGSDWFKGIGTEKSPGTKVFSITGDINNVGCVEVPIGTKLSSIVNEIGGGMVEGKNFKAAQLGGPSGGCIPLEHLDVEVDYETLQEYGAIMGSGGLIVISDTQSAVDIARFFMQFCQEEACGKCIPGREGTKQMLNILNRIYSGKGRTDDIEKLEELALVIQSTALCALCKTSANPVLSTLRYFRKEYEEAITA
ncbi:MULTISPECIES: NuoF family protein [unclassified Oceanispirochaeta]|uniref:NuoF family protein n=1 Tax=unclassified Oceanispirochaeta TaxID=2635722 RepID=UPI0018F53D0C|nr:MULTISPECIES: NuoF family protein [unclassified Oceanispirochaeta]